jgi:hypothetical protein
MTTPMTSENAPAYWRRRAEEARRAAGQMVDPISKKTLLAIAAAYEQLAASAEGTKRGTEDPTKA